MTDHPQRLAPPAREAALIAAGDAGPAAGGSAPQRETGAPVNAAASDAAESAGPRGEQRNGNGTKRAAVRPAERRRARRVALQTLYELDCTRHNPVVALQYRLQGETFARETVAFVSWLVGGVLAYREELDQLIGRYAPEWPVPKLAVVDRNVLRLSIFELTSPDADAPPKVVINEAVELAKTFGSDSSPRFVNGVLGAALREISRAPAHALEQADGSR